MKTSIILMTALVPTIGHKALVDFALNLSDKVVLVISSRSFEPVDGRDRVAAFEMEFECDDHLFIVEHKDDTAPQNPKTEDEWNYWKNVVDQAARDAGWPDHKFDYFVASEPYGKQMADLIGAEFMPFDIGRGLVDVKGTSVRSSIERNWNEIMPSFRRIMLTTVTLFGQESTGKTTLASRLAAVFNTSFIPEFARPYLEALEDKSITDARMDDIHRGQVALQMTGQKFSKGCVIFQDTDLYSTVGYYDIYGGTPDQMLEFDAAIFKSDLYVVMNDEIPFERDPLRYGGHQRESTKQFWIDLLERNNCHYIVVKNKEPAKQLQEITDYIDNFLDEKFEAIETFRRD